MTAPRLPPPAADPLAPGPAADPLARVGRQLIAAERRLRWRRTRRRIAAGSLGGVALLAVAAVVALPGAGGERPAPGGSPATTRATTPPDLASRRVASVELSLRGGATANATVVARVSARLARTGLPVASVSGHGATVVVELAGRSADPAHVSGVFASRPLVSGQVGIYDWEQTVIGSDGRPVADEQHNGALSQISEAAGDARYGFTSREASALAKQAGRGARVVEAIPSQSRADRGPARFYVLRGEPALTGADITGAHAIRSQWGQPTVTYALSPDGQARFHALTRMVSQRGQSLLRPGAPAGMVAQHVAIVVDGRLVSVSMIDPAQLPDGIDGARGVTLSGSYTTAEAQQLAQILATGLPALGGFAMKLSHR